MLCINMDETDLSGWERFFDKLFSFIRTLNRGTANEDFSEYVVERLETCTRSVSALIHHLRLNTPTDEEAARVEVQYSANLSELLECVMISCQDVYHKLFLLNYVNT